MGRPYFLKILAPRNEAARRHYYRSRLFDPGTGPVRRPEVHRGDLPESGRAPFRTDPLPGRTRPGITPPRLRRAD